MSKKNGKKPVRKVDHTDIELAVDADLNKLAESEGMDPTPRERIKLEDAVRSQSESDAGDQLLH